MNSLDSSDDSPQRIASIFDIGTPLASGYSSSDESSEPKVPAIVDICPRHFYDISNSESMSPVQGHFKYGSESSLLQLDDSTDLARPSTSETSSIIGGFFSPSEVNRKRPFSRFDPLYAESSSSDDSGLQSGLFSPRKPHSQVLSTGWFLRLFRCG